MAHKSIYLCTTTESMMPCCLTAKVKMFSCQILNKSWDAKKRAMRLKELTLSSDKVWLSAVKAHIHLQNHLLYKPQSQYVAQWLYKLYKTKFYYKDKELFECHIYGTHLTLEAVLVASTACSTNLGLNSSSFKLERSIPQKWSIISCAFHKFWASLNGHV